jgi:hypothetical protein
MTSHTFDITTLGDGQLRGYATVVQAHLTIAINLGSRAEVTVSSAVATPAHGDEEPSPAQIAPGTGAHDTAQIDDLVSDADEFTSMPSATAVPVPATGDPGPAAVEANGTGNGHTTTLAG